MIRVEAGLGVTRMCELLEMPRATGRPRSPGSSPTATPLARYLQAPPTPPAATIQQP